ncbi:hypothetical protein [Dactylosporangium sp. NPDC051541]|uniref:hypothetical protein n=1 Tax=Dactylosporangium sp. NPDC051541 TaxID=3363977 RepID=UPI00378BE89F
MSPGLVYESPTFAVVEGMEAVTPDRGSASPDLLRSMVKTFAEALMSAEADASTPWRSCSP